MIEIDHPKWHWNKLKKFVKWMDLVIGVLLTSCINLELMNGTWQYG
jgi:hypothetical protein